MSNIKWFLQRREELKQYGPQMVFQFIVQEKNHHEAKLFMKTWQTHFKNMSINSWVDKSTGDAIGEVKRTTIYFRRLQTVFEDQDTNKKLQHKLMKELGLV